MGRKPLLPDELLRGPFTVEEAKNSGLSRWHLEGASWKRIGPATYVWAALPDDPMHRIQAALRRLPASAVVSGRTAAWLHGIDVAPCDPIEVALPTATGISRRWGMAVHRSALGVDETVCVRGLRATSVVRTIADLARSLSLTEAVVVADAALHNRKVRLVQLEAWASANATRPGIRNLRRVLNLVEPKAESPMESRLRMVLVLGGLPRPGCQVPIHDRSGRFVGRPDLCYEDQRLGIEYDGGTHRETLAQDNWRQNALLRAGVHLLRFTARDVLGNPASVVGQVREMLTTVGPRGFGTREFAARVHRREK